MANLDQLYTGTNTEDTTFGNEEVDQQQLETVTEQQRLLAELLPSVQYIRDICDDEIDAISNIRSYGKDVGPLTTKAKREDFMDEMRARELYIGFIERLKDGIENMVANAEAEASK